MKKSKIARFFTYRGVLSFILTWIYGVFTSFGTEKYYCKTWFLLEYIIVYSNHFVIKIQLDNR